MGTGTQHFLCPRGLGSFSAASALLEIRIEGLVFFTLRQEKGRITWHLGFFSHICIYQPSSLLVSLSPSNQCDYSPSCCLHRLVHGDTILNHELCSWGHNSQSSQDLDHFSFLPFQLHDVCIKRDSWRWSLVQDMKWTQGQASRHMILHPQAGQVTHYQSGKSNLSQGNPLTKGTTV